MILSCGGRCLCCELHHAWAWDIIAFTGTRLLVLELLLPGIYSWPTACEIF